MLFVSENFFENLKKYLDDFICFVLLIFISSR